MTTNMQRWSRLIGAGLVAVAVSGCATTDHVYSGGRCLTCVNNPITGEPINYDPNENTGIEEQAVASGQQVQNAPEGVTGNGRGSFRIESGVDVDTAYARLRSGFRFRAPSDFLDSLSDRMAQRDVAYHHDANPGSFYRLSDYERQMIDGREHMIILKAQLERSGSGSRINVEFMPSGTLTYNVDEMQDALQQRFDTVLR
ncbi:MAG: hypothetical protein JJT87_12300 [Halomonas sp.]|nr:hypothetical protein [Halomonas sp.]MCC5902690.1 hypothetical protein [Halomonas sp.]